MGSVTLNFSEEEYRIFHRYCTNYCHLYDETRKNSIKVFLELYQHQVIDIQEHSLENVFLFFYGKKQEFEIECQVPGCNPDIMMRLRLCSDIIAFLEDLEKIYLLLRKKGIDANYYLILGAFLKISHEENRKRQEDLFRTSAGEINAIVLPLRKDIEKKSGQDADTRTILRELVSFVNVFNTLSPDLTINDEIMNLIGISLLRAFGKEETDEEISAQLNICREEAETDDFEAALEGYPRVQRTGAEGADFSWKDLLQPLRILNERVVQAQARMRLPPEVLSALAVPVKMGTQLPGYSPVIPYQYPIGQMRKWNNENRIIVNVGDRPTSEVRISPAVYPVSFGPADDDPYKRYFSITAGVLVLLVLIIVAMTYAMLSASGTFAGNGTNESAGIAMAGAATGNNSSRVVLSSPKTVTAGTPVPTRPTPTPTPRYVTVELVQQEPDPGPKSHRELFETTPGEENFLFNPDDYLTIYGTTMEYQANAYRFSFNLKNPPMVIHYTVIPQNITDVKWFSPTDAKKLIDTAVITRPFENAWFEITIYQDGSLYDRVGWGREFGNPLYEQEVVIRDSGEYQIEFSGDFSKVATEVLVKPEGNILA